MPNDPQGSIMTPRRSKMIPRGSQMAARGSKMAAWGFKMVHQSENLSKCSGQKSTCRFFWSWHVLCRKHVPVFSAGPDAGDPPQMRGGDAKMTPKATKNNKREVFCYVQKNDNFHWFKRTWAPKDALQSQQLDAKNFKKECQGNKMEHKGANMSQKAPKKNNLGNKIKLKGPKMETRGAKREPQRAKREHQGYQNETK